MRFIFKLLIFIFAVFVLALIFNEEEKYDFKINYECVRCLSRNTSLLLHIIPLTEFEYNSVYITAYYDKKIRDMYECYPSIFDKYRHSYDSVYKQSLTNQDVWCYYNTTALKKPGNYVLEITLYNTFEDMRVSKNISLSIQPSNLTPEILLSKPIFEINTLIPMNPIPNMYVINYSLVSSIPVLKCSKIEGVSIEYYCSQTCSQQVKYLEELKSCKDLCIKEKKEELCNEDEYKEEGKKFVVVNYGVGVKKENVPESISCDELKNGMCLIPVSISFASNMIQNVFKVLNSDVLETLTSMSFGLGFIGTSYDFAIMDEWDVMYNQLYLPQTNTTTYYLNMGTIPPLVFAIDERENPSYLIAKRKTEGLFLFIIPVKKQEILYAVRLK